MVRSVLVGDRVRWVSSEGTKRGEVVGVYNALDEFGDTVNFCHIEYSDGFGGTTLAMLPESQVTVTFRDINIQIERGERAEDGSFLPRA